MIPVLHEIDIKIGPDTPEGCLLRDFECFYPLSLEFSVNTHLFNFEGKKDISSPYLVCASSIETNISMDTPENVKNIHDLSIPVASLDDLRESKECEGDATMHIHELDYWHSCNADDEKYIVKENLLKESCDEIEH